MIPQSSEYFFKKKINWLLFFTPVLMEWSVDIIMKFLAYTLNWSWFYCCVWLTARHEHEKEGPFLPSPPPPHTLSTSSGNSKSLKLCWKRTLETSESAVFIASASQCHSHSHCLEPSSLKEQPPPISPQKFTKSRTDQGSQSNVSSPPSLCLPFCHFNVKTLLST